MKPKVWLYVLGASLGAALIGVSVLASSVSGLKADLATAEKRADEAEEEAEDVQVSLEETEEDLRVVKKSLRNARAEPPAPTGNLSEQLANGTAQPTEGLSVSLPAEFWKCTQWRGDECRGLKDEAVFKNETQVGSAATCLFEITYEDGATTTFTWTSEYVPPGGGTDTQVVYFYSDYSSAIDLMGESDCYRGSAKYSSGIGE